MSQHSATAPFLDIQPAIYPPQHILHVQTKRAMGRTNHPSCPRNHHRVQKWYQHVPNLTLIVPDASKCQYRFIDEIVLDTSDPRTFTNATYLENITLSSLTNHPAKLIQLGSLFSSRRLKLSDPTHRAIRKQTQRHMSLKHPLLQKSSVDIVTKMKISVLVPGSGFLSAHLRDNDGHFLETAMEHSRMFW
ncbi:hypothetical protein BDM02DRAFT_2362315 [Thelephora ganbajun]|uniref:Uncharacterized protein n=1 Tax=Thelephora ganbajun TaxID=370292 RepID=A0ACB6YYE1_THEGA|nr:hypothetical protein BDM02DRAFT_2362315 [Thelephora ganbajun]